jgi:hypothetical protein
MGKSSSAGALCLPKLAAGGVGKGGQLVIGL